MFARLLLLLPLLALLAGAAHAQDLLTKRNGDEVPVKVVEITPTEVKYRRTDNPDGPLISIYKADVFLIRYANGTKEVFNSSAVVPGPASPPAAVRAAFEPAPVPATGPPVSNVPTGSTVPTLGNVDPNDAILNEPIQLDGPRVGITILSNGVVNKSRENCT